ncbi:DUF6877 family protein [Sporosarcina sp. FSL K6-3457]
MYDCLYLNILCTEDDPYIYQQLRYANRFVKE